VRFALDCAPLIRLPGVRQAYSDRARAGHDRPNVKGASGSSALAVLHVPPRCLHSSGYGLRPGDRSWCCERFDPASGGLRRAYRTCDSCWWPADCSSSPDLAVGAPGAWAGPQCSAPRSFVCRCSDGRTPLARHRGGYPQLCLRSRGLACASPCPEHLATTCNTCRQSSLRRTPRSSTVRSRTS